MARYSTDELDYSVYDTGTYGSDDVPRYRVVYLEALATDKFKSYIDTNGDPVFNRITVFWQYEDPTLEVQRVRVLRSIRGFAIGYNDPSSTVLIDTKFPEIGLDTISYGKVNYPTDLTNYITDTGIVPGRDYYYSIFLIDPGIYDDNDLIDRWTPVAFVKTKAPKDHKSISKMLGALPPYMTSTDVPENIYEVTGTGTPLLNNPNAYLPKFIAGLAWLWDYVTTDADRIRSIWNPLSAPAETVKSLVESLGLPYEPSFGDSRARALLEYVDTIHGYSGAQEGVRALAEALSGASANVTIGSNILLDIQNASFTTGIGYWTPTIQVVTVNPIEDDSLDHAPDTVFAIDEAPTACAVLALNDENATIISASGVSNSEIRHRNNFVRVTTQVAHGLSVGDIVEITGADEGFLNDTWKIERVFDHVSYGFSVTGSTEITGDVGRTVAPASTYENPFAICQGIPVAENTDYVFVYRAVADDAVLSSLSVTWYDFLGNLISEDSVSIEESISTSAWTPYGGYATSPLRAKFAVLSLTASTGTLVNLYLDKFHVYEVSDLEDPIPYEEPRTVKIILSYGVDKGFDDRITRSVVTKRVTERVRNTLAIGTPLIVRMAPVIRTMQAGIPTLYQFVEIDEITFKAAYDTPTAEWSTDGLPAGLSLDSSTGILSGTPTVYGSYTVVFTVTDENGVSSSKPFFFNIIED